MGRRRRVARGLCWIHCLRKPQRRCTQRIGLYRWETASLVCARDGMARCVVLKWMIEARRVERIGVPVRTEEGRALMTQRLQRVGWCVAVGLASVMLTPLGVAQSATGSLDGVVKDATGAIVPNAVVTVTDEEAHATQSVVTNEGGAYALPKLASGRYEVEVTANGLDSSHSELTVADHEASHWDAVLSFAGTYSAKGYRDVAYWREPGVRVEVSSFEFHSRKFAEQRPCPLNRGLGASGAPAFCSWDSNQFQHLPQWVWIHFAGPRRIDKMVLHAGSLATSPVEFSGETFDPASSTFHTFFHVEGVRFDPQTLTYTVHFTPVVTDNVRLVIERTEATETPQSWIAELKQLEVYGTDAAGAEESASSEVMKGDAVPAELASVPALASTGYVPEVKDLGESVEICTPWYRIVLDKRSPRMQSLSLDSLGKDELDVNLLQESGAVPFFEPVFQDPMPLGAAKLTRDGDVFRYEPVELAPGVYEQVSIRAGLRGFDLGLTAAANHRVMMRGGLFRFHFAANETPTTFVGHPSAVMNYVSVPTYLDAPDFGTVYVTRTGDEAAFYRTPSSLFPATTYWVDVTPHQPVTEDGLNEIGPTPWHTTLHFGVESLEPTPALLSRDSRLERFPKYSLDGTQWRPDTGILSNSVMSIDCGLAILFYAEEAVYGPHLQDGISQMALVGASVDRYFDGARGYQMPHVNVFDPDWHTSRETPAYLVISGWDDIRTIGGMEQLHKWERPLEAVADHIESGFGKDGLIYNADRGMWFDVYEFRGASAYSNAADYRAFLCMSDLETLAGRPELAKRYAEDAAKIKAAYFASFFNPATGVLAGWRDREGTLHDYMFPWVNGYAIYQGLVPQPQAKRILQTLLAKMDSIGFHSYQLGLPTNLIPMSPKDYIAHTSGAPKQADGMDSWQVYMNGGATPAFENYFIQALYQTGQTKDAERLLWALMGSYEKGTFNAGVQLPGETQRNPVGSAFYTWDGSRGRGEGYLPEDWTGIEALFIGHYGIGFDKDGYFLEPWSPLKGKRVKLDMPYMGKNVPYVSQSRAAVN